MMTHHSRVAHVPVRTYKVVRRLRGLVTDEKRSLFEAPQHAVCLTPARDVKLHPLLVLVGTEQPVSRTNMQIMTPGSPQYDHNAGHDARLLVPKLLSRYSKVKRLSVAEHERRDAYRVP